MFQAVADCEARQEERLIRMVEVLNARIVEEILWRARGEDGIAGNCEEDAQQSIRAIRRFLFCFPNLADRCVSPINFD